MNLFTEINIPDTEFKIDYQSHLVFIGSCFAENISRQFSDRKFHTLVNPTGTIYNPLSIEHLIGKLTGENTEPWSHWDYQGSFSEEQLDNTIVYARNFLKKTDTVFITLGTAFVYFLKETGKAVANCHKEPAELFERRLISVDEAAEALRNTVTKLRHINSQLQVVFTISPIRHLNDGAHGNNLSKATLQLAVDKVIQEFAGNAAVSYFPSYEIVMDELRDYRFYAEDMTHVNAVAEKYIFERMVQSYCNDTTIAHIKYVEKFMKGATHRIEDTSSPRTKDFAKLQIERAENLEHVINGLDLSKEKEYFRTFI